MSNDILKIGEVIEVRGQKVRAKVYQDKNTSTLNYNGEIVKNISVGSFVKIRKNFLSIIGKVEGEYVNDKVNKETFLEKNQFINRVIEISIVGRIESDGTFKKGLSELPLISNYVYVLTDMEVQKVFAFVNEDIPVIQVGDINSYEKYKMSLGVQKLFGSHIGIFGNTGSGKSNTLAKLYTELFNIYKDSKAFQNNSRFILIDFNGEYEKSITDKKDVVKLSTSERQDTYILNKKEIQDIEFWSIILEATEKTQQPFLKRAINQYKYLVRKAADTNEILQQKTIELLDGLYDFGNKYVSVKRYYEEIIDLGYIDMNEEKEKFFNHIAFNSNSGHWYYVDQMYGEKYRNTEEEFKESLPYQKLIEALKNPEKRIAKTSVMDYWKIFEFAMKYQYVYDIQRGFINEEHVAPIIRRLDTRLDDLQKVFSLEENVLTENNLQVISLVDVNIYMRKVVPMLICKKEYDNHKKQNSRERKNALFVIVDEAHNILSKDSERESNAWKDYRLEVFEEIIKEGRKFGVFLTIASQRPADISDTIVSQLHNYFLHRLVNSEDIKAIGKTVAFLDTTSFEMIPILPQGACVVTGTACNFPVIVQVDLLDEDKQPKSTTIDLHGIWK